MKESEFDAHYKKIEAIFTESDSTAHAKRYYFMQTARFKVFFSLINPIITSEEKGLDIGIYPGYFTYCLKKGGYNIEAVDIYPERINKNIRKELVIKKCDIETQKLPYMDNTFDYVIFAAIIEHLRVNPLFVLREIRRVLKPNGRIILQTPNFAYWKRRLAALCGKGLSQYKAYKKLEELGHSGHVTIYSLNSLIEMLTKTGFKTIVKKHIQNHIKIRQKEQLLDSLFGIMPSLRKQLFVVGCKKE